MRPSAGILALGGLVLFAGSEIASSLAQEAASVVEKRQTTMKRMRGDLKTIREFGEGNGNQERAVAAATDVAQTLRTVHDLFPPRTGMVDFPGQSSAKPGIWTDWYMFLVAQKVAVAKADALLGGLKSGNKGRAPTGASDLWENGCQVCHRSFREEI
jgi:cytochrome c556